jgi:adenosine kinase
MAGLPKVSGTRPRVVVVTQGGGETVVASQGKLARYPVEKLANELLVDINGAGDAFVGGFVAKLLQGKA